jgi:hypothetical protein
MNHYSIHAREVGSDGIFFPVLVRATTWSEALTHLKEVLQMETNGVSRTLIAGKWVKLAVMGDDG